MKYYYVYVLDCLDQKGKQNFYIGYSKNLLARIQKHQRKEVKTTKKFVKLRLVYFEGCCNKLDAVNRELQLKTGFGRGYIQRRLVNWSTESKKRD